MKMTSSAVWTALLAILLVPAAVFGQEQPPERGTVELGVRGIWGTVYGRPDLPFAPSLANSKFNEYRDLKNGFYLRGFVANFDHVLGSRNYLNVQSRSAVYKDQSFLVTFGKNGKYKIQFRYDETPHVYTNTARTLLTETAPGVYRFSGTTLPSTSTGDIANAVNGLSLPFIAPSIERKAGSGLVGYSPTPAWDLALSFSRENEIGTRPIGFIMNSSPSASLSRGYGVEVPEPIDYFTNQLKATAEYSRANWGVRVGYLGSFFENNKSDVVFDNPFNTVDAIGSPARGSTALYPDNSAHNLSFAGAFNITKYLRLMASIVPGWMRQNESFAPYTSNPVLLAITEPLPASSLHGSKQTLAMNYTLTSRFAKNLELTARYRQYDYNNNTPVLELTPVIGDAGQPGEPEDTAPHTTSFYRKNFEFFGTWFFGKKSSLKLGYEWEGMDRKRRDVDHTSENGLISALDLNPRKDLLLRFSYRHSSRTPDHYENASEEMLPEARRFDENARRRNRGDALLQYSPLSSLTLSASYGTVQDNYNIAANSETGQPYGFLLSGAMPYYSYGLLKDIGYNYSFDMDYAASTAVSVFAEYTREKYKMRLLSRQRTMISGTEELNPDADVPANDWTSFNHDIIDTYTTGIDLYLRKKGTITTYYSLSAGQGHNFTQALGNASLFTDPALFLNKVVMDFPKTTSRIHEVGAVFRFNIGANFTPRIEYRYQQFDNKDYQTSAMRQYMGAASPTASSYYPYVGVFDTSAARYLFLGADNPSYGAHLLSVSLQYHF